MAASSLLLLRLAEYLRARKTALTEDAVASCQEDRREDCGWEEFPWKERLGVMILGTATALLGRAAVDGASPASPAQSLDAASAGVQAVLSEAWLVRNSFLRALNRFQGEQSSKKGDFTALDMTEVRQEAVREFDRAVSGALSEWIVGAARSAAVPASSVSDLYDGMRAIQGLLQMASGMLPPGAKGHVATAAQQLGRLAANAQMLIHGQADSTAPQGGIAPSAAAAPAANPALAIAPLDVPTFVQSIAEIARPVAQKKGLRLEYRRNPGPQVFKTDGEKLHRAATLILNYALSLTEHGEVSVATGADERGQFLLEIHDTSAGVPPEILAKLLQGLAQAPDEEEPAGDPTIGVSLARDLVVLLGGNFEAASQPGGGNCFKIRLPLL